MSAEQQAVSSNHSAFSQTKLISALVFVSSLLIAGWYRFAQLGLKPFHHDEGVNAHFLLQLVKGGSQGYRYNPENYHGPTLYYLTLPALKLFGESDFALRFFPCLFGVLVIALLWYWRERLGEIGLPVAALALALSPGMIFFSRYFIHEMSFGFFALGIAVGMWEYGRTQQFRWMALLAVCAGFFFATKETAIITVVVFVVSLLCASLWDITRALWRTGEFSLGALFKQLLADCRAVAPTLDHACSALILFGFINVFFYTSAFTNWAGIGDAFKALQHWTAERSGKDHVHAFAYYLGILFKLELPLLLGGLLAGALIIWRGSRFWLFVGSWTFGLTLAYSWIPYKTPWLMVSFMIPLVLACGYAAQQVTELLPALSLRIGWLLLVGVALFASGQLAYEVNFQKYEDNSNTAGYFTEPLKARGWKPYVDGQYGFVYAQTDRAFLDFVKTLQASADRMASQKATGIFLATSDYWPLPWYMRDYTGVAFTGNLPKPLTETAIPQPILVIRSDQQAEVEATNLWYSVGRSFTLRPGVDLMIYLRNQP